MGTSATAAEERRQLPRRPFRATVELALGDEADGYEADAVDLSIGGMALKTAFLPDVGSELECRFALEGGQPIAARAEVVWARDSGAEAGAFGLRFTDLAGTHESAIRRSFPVDAADALPTSPGAKPEVDQGAASRARLFLRGMEAPLRTRVRTSMDDALVLGSELSFLKLGEAVEVERDGERVPAAIEDVSVEVDPHTSVACLVLTLALATRAIAPTTRATVLPPPGEPDDEALESAPPVASPPSRARRPAQATAVLASSDVDPEAHAALHASEAPPAARSAGAQPVLEMATSDVLASDAGSLRRAPPAWLVAALARVRAALRWLASHAGPGAQRAFAAAIALATKASGFVRSKLPGRAAEDASVAEATNRRPGGPALRKQHVTDEPSSDASTPPRVAWLSRGRYGLYGLAGVGTLAIIAALATGRREPHARTPHPTVAVAPAASPPGAEAAPTAAPGATDTANNAAVAPTAADPNAVDPGAGEAAEPAPPPSDPRRMPSDLVAAARSRSANVDDAPTLRYGRASAPSAPRANSRGSQAALATAAAAPVAGTRIVGNPAVRTGTMLRLRMDGPVATLTGGTAGNTITLHLAGRRSLDLAAPLVRQDTRLVNAGVYNHGGNVDLTLRFRDAVPAFAARGHGDVLEIVLAPSTATASRARRPARPAVVASARRRGVR